MKTFRFRVDLLLLAMEPGGIKKSNATLFLGFGVEVWHHDGLWYEMLVL